MREHYGQQGPVLLIDIERIYEVQLACIRIVRAFMWEPLKEDVVLVECVSY